ncbi:MAG: Cbb3-type cytochrome oxidase component FixQ, partial [Pseudomonadota bacterium]
GLVGWAWSDARRASFDASARVPLEEDAGLVRTDREHSSEHRA